MNNSCRNDYEKIIAAVFDGDSQKGSACLLWSNNKENLYCVTANHCTCKEGVEFDVHIKQRTPEGIIEYTIAKSKVKDEANDIAIFELIVDENCQDIPFTITSDLRVPPQKCYIYGCPININSRRAVIETLLAEYVCQDRSGIVKLNLPHLDDDNVTRYDEIVGLSGGGCFEAIGNTIKFFGIENSALNRDVTYKEVNCISFRLINNLLKNENMNLLPNPVPDYISNPIGEYKLIDDVLSQLCYGNKWRTISTTNSIFSNVQAYFASKTESALFICGLSGIGKTRSVLMACKENGYENTLYYEDYSKFKNDFRKLKDYASQTEDTFCIIVDEAKLEDWCDINDKICANQQFFRIIFIGTYSLRKKVYDRNFINIESCTTDDVSEIIQAQYPLFTEEELQGIIDLSHRDLRLAILIARIYSAEKRSNMHSDIMNGRASRLFDRYSSAQDILKRTIEQTRNSIPTGFDLSVYFERLSLFVDIGFGGRNSEELVSIANFFKDEKSEFLRAIDYLTEVDLGIKKESLFELCPRALAKCAFEESGWETIRYKMKEFMESIPSNILRQRFFDRVDECAMREEVNEALVSWFRSKYYHKCIKDLENLDMNEACIYIEHSPDIGLAWLKDVIQKATDSELSSFSGGFSSSRRNIIWTCERLANFKEFFYDCEEILFKLASNENEYGISNNSTGVWSGYFSIFTSNTEIPFCERYDHLIYRASDITNNIELFTKAFTAAFSDGNIRWVPPKSVGGMITPNNWKPKDVKELQESMSYALQKLSQSIEDINERIRIIAIDILIQYIGNYIKYGIIDEYKYYLDGMKLNQQQKNLLILNIEKQIRIMQRDSDKAHCSDDTTQKVLENWIIELKDVTLQGKIDEYLVRNIYLYGTNEGAKKRNEDIFEDIALQIINAPNKVDIVKSIVSNNTYNSGAVNKLAEHLAVQECDFDFEEIVKYVSDKKLDNSFLRGYYIGKYNKNNRIDKKLMDIADTISDSNPDFSLWVSIAFDISDNGYKKIIALLNNSNQLNYIDNMKYDRWYNFLTLQRKLDLCDALFKLKSDMGYGLCFELLYAWIFQGEKEPLIFEFSIDKYEQIIINNIRTEIYVIHDLLERFPESYNKRIGLLLIKSFDFNGISSQYNNDYVISYIKQIVNCENEKEFMNALGERLIESNKSLRGRAYRGIFDIFSNTIVKEWIDEDTINRAPMIAYHLMSPNLEHTEWSSLTVYILSEYKTRVVYDNFILGEFSFVCFSPEKDYYNRKEEWDNLLGRYVNSENECIRRWATYEKGYVESMCTECRQRKEEDLRYS